MDLYTTCVIEIGIHSPIDFLKNADIGTIAERKFPCPKNNDWPYHKHNKMKIIGNNNYLATSGTYGVRLFVIGDDNISADSVENLYGKVIFEYNNPKDYSDLRKNFKGLNYIPGLNTGAIVAGTNDG